MTMLRRLIVFYCITTFVGVPATLASEQPAQKLKQTQKELHTSRQENRKIKDGIFKLEREMAKLTDEITSIAKELQTSERKLSKIEAQLQQFERDRQTKQKEINNNKQYIAGVLASLIRLEQVPQQAVLMMPGSAIEKINVSRALSLTTHSLKDEMDELGMQIVSIRKLEQDITQKRNDIAEKAGALQNRQQQLRHIVSQRKNIMQTLHSEDIAGQRKINALIKQSKNLESLITTLEQNRIEQRHAAFDKIGLPQAKPKIPKNKKSATKVVTTEPSGTIRSFIKAKGKLLLPAQGRIIGTYGQKRGKENTLKGIEIKTRKSAQVIATYDGDVMFTGPFMDYGNIVILRHTHDYHTLLAGFNSIDVVVGQRIREGEPIGIMGNKDANQTLYVELRYHSKPINPKAWIAEFKTYLAKR